MGLLQSVIMRRRYVFRSHDSYNLLNDIRVGRGKIVFFYGIRFEVVELERCFRAQSISFPVSQTHRLLKESLVDFEIQRFVLLGLILTKQGW